MRMVILLYIPVGTYKSKINVLSIIFFDKLLALYLAHEFPIGHWRTNVGQLGLSIVHLGDFSQDKFSSFQVLVPIYLEIGMVTEKFFFCLGGSETIPLLLVEPLHLIHLVEYPSRL